MFSAGVFIVSLASIRACVWFCFNFVSLLPFLTFLFILGVGEEVNHNALSFIYWRIYKSFDNFRVSLQYLNYYSEANCVLNHWSNENYNNLYCSFLFLFYFIFFNCKFNITRFYICYCFLLLLLSFFHIVYYF